MSGKPGAATGTARADAVEILGGRPGILADSAGDPSAQDEPVVADQRAPAHALEQALACKEDVLDGCLEFLIVIAPGIGLQVAGRVLVADIEKPAAEALAPGGHQ